MVIVVNIKLLYINNKQTQDFNLTYELIYFHFLIQIVIQYSTNIYSTFSHRVDDRSITNTETVLYKDVSGSADLYTIDAFYSL